MLRVLSQVGGLEAAVRERGGELPFVCCWLLLVDVVCFLVGCPGFPVRFSVDSYCFVFGVLGLSVGSTRG